MVNPFFYSTKDQYDKTYESRMKSIVERYNVYKHLGSNHMHGLKSFEQFKRECMDKFDEIDKKQYRDRKW